MLLPNSTELVPPSPSCGMIENRISARSRRFMSGTVSKVDRNLNSAKYYTTINRRDPGYQTNQLSLSTKSLTAPFLRIPELDVPMGIVVNVPKGHAVKVAAGTQTNLPRFDIGQDKESPKPATESEPASESKPKAPEPNPCLNCQGRTSGVPKPVPSATPCLSSLLPKRGVSEGKKMYTSAKIWENLIRRPVPIRPMYSEPIPCPTPPVVVFPPDYTRLRMPVFDHIVKGNLKKDYAIHPDFLSESLHLPYIAGQASNPLKYGWVG